MTAAMNPGEKRADNGHFLPGTKGGPGRKPGRPDIYGLALKMADAEGYDLHKAIYEVVKKMLLLAANGDVAAARIALEHLGMPARYMLDMNLNLPEVPESMTQEEIERRVASLLATAAARRATALLTNGHATNGHANGTNGHAAPPGTAAPQR